MGYMAICNILLTFAGLVTMNVAARRVGETR
jgi:hypothetical protein